ncbi:MULTISPECIES: hypothetical protein [Alteromonadaceae]|uniref:hypothetical protein n=1 Tax=Alteromonadaceae TaxID=72275 RepID=UPI001C0A19B2|nr:MULTISPECIES: hypothetical protein [Aliiglaciecola]MBU2878831.1 hypothetical protein [Aliiglaciecola lipolytica]MDO6711270.1 hypothetical protein [Aliiglaciecola sp. 2_MG-2023]MDO6752281.1 hypothetical protein [Aliiglaciecola sp. 1_MG-2023]
MATTKKQAVVLVHGIGEQRPMETVREFVKSVWVKDSNIENTRFWNKPSEVSGSFEHRRLTTDYATIKNNAEKKTTSRVDFYEYYWAHHTVGTTLEHLRGWVFSMLRRKPSDYPSALKPMIYLLWGLIFTILLILISIGFFEPTEKGQGGASLHGIYESYISPILLFVLSIAVAKIVSYLGDVARYITATPSNIKVRKEIRDGGVKLLESIAQTGKYDRIVLVGHSLGSIIAYDVLTQYWARKNKFKNAAGESLPLSENALKLIHAMEEMDHQPKVEEYRKLQYQLFEQLKLDSEAHGEASGMSQWLVSDLVTLGSPLTYADFLLFDNKMDFVDRKLDREYPTSPPVKENEHYYYQTTDAKFLHHGAVFSLVRWTNIYSKPFNIFCGDLISGPVSRAFSNPQISKDLVSEEQPASPILDIDVEAAYPKRNPRLFTHTNYWRWHDNFDRDGAPDHILKLRESLGLVDW